jgi:hypothetical protein
MLISLPVLSLEQIPVPIWVKHDSMHCGPITLLEPLVVLVGRHKDMLVKKSQTRRGRESQGGLLGKHSRGCWGSTVDV